MEMIKLPETAKIIKDESKTFKMKELKRMTKDELWTIYKKTLVKNATI